MRFGSGSKLAHVCFWLYSYKISKAACSCSPCVFLSFAPVHCIPHQPLISASDYDWQKQQWIQNKGHPHWGRGASWKPNAMILCTAALTFLVCFLSLSGKYTDIFSPPPSQFPAIFLCFPKMHCLFCKEPGSANCSSPLLGLIYFSLLFHCYETSHGIQTELKKNK